MGNISNLQFYLDITYMAGTPSINISNIICFRGAPLTPTLGDRGISNDETSL